MRDSQKTRVYRGFWNTNLQELHQLNSFNEAETFIKHVLNSWPFESDTELSSVGIVGWKGKSKAYFSLLENNIYIPKWHPYFWNRITLIHEVCHATVRTAAHCPRFVAHYVAGVKFFVSEEAAETLRLSLQDTRARMAAEPKRKETP